MIKNEYSSKKRVISGINITPLTDIALTLLTVFMIATPMFIESEIKINMPRAEHTKDLLEKHNIIITIYKNKQIEINKKKCDFSKINEYLKLFHLDSNVIINADKSLDYEFVIKILDLIKHLGFDKISLGVSY